MGPPQLPPSGGLIVALLTKDDDADADAEEDADEVSGL